MANRRIFQEVQGAAFNGSSVSGVTEIVLNQDYADRADAEYSGSAGVARLAVGGQRVRGTMRYSDVPFSLFQFLATPISTLTFKGRESGAATYSKVTVKAPVPYGIAWDMPFGQMASCSLDFQSRFGDADQFSDVIKVEGADATAPSQGNASRIWRAKSVAFTPVGGVEIALAHIQGVTVRVAPRGGGPLEDWGDEDYGTTAVEVPDFEAIAVTINSRDAKEAAATDADIVAQLLEAREGDLTIVFAAVGDLDEATLLIRNVKFTGSQRTSGAGWTGHAISGAAQWQDHVDKGTSSAHRSLSGIVGQAADAAEAAVVWTTA